MWPSARAQCAGWCWCRPCWPSPSTPACWPWPSTSWRGCSAEHEVLGRAVAVAHHLTVPHQRPFDEPAHRLRIDPVLRGQHARGQRRGIVARQHRHRGLHDDGAMVELGGHEMHRGTGQLAAHCQRPLVRVQAGEGRQQRRMNIEQTAGIARREAGRQDAHEAGQHDQVGREPVNDARQLGIKVLATRKGLVVDHGRRDAVRRREREAAGLGPVADDRRHLGRPALGLAGLHDGLHVGASAGNQNHHALHGPAV
mmetsp:Transcript_42317/g.99297  ORF Transcript_42317/g.99297 Transcript_42317/m.99297 type:complete len:254 (+) Transcript_42317:3155-3916(+)